jgi:hypothetical protein
MYIRITREPWTTATARTLAAARMKATAGTPETTATTRTLAAARTAAKAGIIGPRRRLKDTLSYKLIVNMFDRKLLQ